MFCNRCGRKHGLGVWQCDTCGAVLASPDPPTSASPLGSTEASVSTSPTAQPGESTGRVCLLVLTGERRGTKYVLVNGVHEVGRSQTSDLVLNDVTVSRRHAEIVVDGSSPSVRDLGSLNGTWLNGQRVDDARLTHGDTLHVGRIRLVVVEAS